MDSRFKPRAATMRFKTATANLVKRSAGIACCRYSDKQYEVLMVRKRYTHAFATFLFGKYTKSDDDGIVMLFDGMTNQEKLDVCSLRFDVMWYRVWLTIESANGNLLNRVADFDWLDIYKKKSTINRIHSTPPRSMRELYEKRKAKFESGFTMDGGGRLMRLMRRSKRSSQLLWEIPKGRIQRNESTIDCAIREFHEETGIPVVMYDIVVDVKTFSDTTTHMNVTYNNHYFVGITRYKFDPIIDFNSSAQIVEIDDVRWVGNNELRYLNQSPQTRDHVTKILKVVKNRYKHIKGKGKDSI
jgi:8-oxo-dGTP pyrophosphatase MutT (NUDIX family)